MVIGKDFVDQVKAMGAYVERLIGFNRREYLDHPIVFGERSLHRWLPQKTRRSIFAKPVVFTIITNAGAPSTIHHTPTPGRGHESMVRAALR